MTEHERNDLDNTFRNCTSGREFKAKADNFAKVMYYALKYMPETTPMSERQEIANSWFEQYRYIQEIAKEIYGEPRLITFNIDFQNK